MIRASSSLRGSGQAVEVTEAERQAHGEADEQGRGAYRRINNRVDGRCPVEDEAGEGGPDPGPEEAPPGERIGVVPDPWVVQRPADPEAVEGVRADLAPHQRDGEGGHEQARRDVDEQDERHETGHWTLLIRSRSVRVTPSLSALAALLKGVVPEPHRLRDDADDRPRCEAPRAASPAARPEGT